MTYLVEGLAASEHFSTLQRAGFVHVVRETSSVQSWQFTDLGLQSLCAGAPVHSPHRLFDIRSDLALEDQSRWELASGLMLQAWVPRAASRGLPAVSLEMGPRIFNIQNPSREYLLVLHKCDEAHARGVQAIPHHESGEFYQRMLLPPDASQVQAMPALRGDGEDKWMALEDAPEMAPPRLLDSLEGIDDALSGDGDDAFMALEDAPELAPPLLNPLERPTGNHTWGCCAFTKVRGVNAWQVQCPFHKNDQRNNCKKRLMFYEGDADSLEEASWRCIVRLRYWATCWGSFTRQWRHVSYTPMFSDCPDVDIIEAQKPSREHGPADILPDDQLDLAESERAKPRRRR